MRAHGTMLVIGWYRIVRYIVWQVVWWDVGCGRGVLGEKVVNECECVHGKAKKRRKAQKRKWVIWRKVGEFQQPWTFLKGQEHCCGSMQEHNGFRSHCALRSAFEIRCNMMLEFSMGSSVILLGRVAQTCHKWGHTLVSTRVAKYTRAG